MMEKRRRPVPFVLPAFGGCYRIAPRPKVLPMDSDDLNFTSDYFHQRRTAGRATE